MNPLVPEEALDAVRVTAERVERFAGDVERDGSEESRRLWRAALADLRDAIRHARGRGCETTEIQEAAIEQPTGRFVRSPEHRGHTRRHEAPGRDGRLERAAAGGLRG